MIPLIWKGLEKIFDIESKRQNRHNKLKLYIKNDKELRVPTWLYNRNRQVCFLEYWSWVEQTGSRRSHDMETGTVSSPDSFSS